MSCKSALYTAMQTPTEVPVDGMLPLGSIIRRYGCDANLNGNAVNITNAGYYDVDASVTVAPTAAGTVTVTLVKDGVPIPGATASAAAAAGDQYHSYSLSSFLSSSKWQYGFTFISWKVSILL